MISTEIFMAFASGALSMPVLDTPPPKPSPAAPTANSSHVVWYLALVAILVALISVFATWFILTSFAGLKYRATRIKHFAMHVSAAIVTAFDAADRHLDRAITFLRHMAQLTIDSVLVPLKHAVWTKTLALARKLMGSLTSTTEVIGKWTIDMSTKGNHFQVVEQVRRDHQDKRDDATGQGEMSSPSVEDKWVVVKM
ncbi:unnamed protein product [Cercospora beticola]|nr:unnamed protein product [Cercospora beticola]